MLYQLPHGGTIKINEELYFRLSDEEFAKYLMYVKGSEINDPFHNSALDNDSALLFDDETIGAMKADLPDIEIDPSEFYPSEE